MKRNLNDSQNIFFRWEEILGKGSTNASLVIVLIIVLVLNGCREQNISHAHDTYTCPMHPTVVSEKPGVCPVCNMDLVRKARPGEEVQMTDELKRLAKSPNQVVVSSIKTIKGSYKTALSSIEVQGFVTYDERRVYTIPARVSGRLEKVMATYAFQRISKGQQLAEIYSPEVIEAQREYIFLLEQDSKNQELIQTAESKLRLLGADQSFITRIANRRVPQATFPVFSLYEGFIVPSGEQSPSVPGKSNSTKTSASMNGEMNTQQSAMEKNTTPIAAAEVIREGSYVASGETLFRLADLSALQVELKLPSPQSTTITNQSRIYLDFGDGWKKEAASIDLIEPFTENGESFITIRIYVDFQPSVKIGGLVKALIKTNSSEGLWVPKEAIVNLGLNQVVFIKNKLAFNPKKVVTGIETEKEIQIMQGLSTADEIAADARYLVDSESPIKPLD